MKIRAYAIIALLAALALCSCGNPLTAHSGDAKGSLVISQAPSSRTIARNLYQWPEAVATLQADGTGPSGQTFSRGWTAGSAVTIDSLGTGAWSIVVKGLDASGAVVRQGNASTTISSNTTNTIAVTLGFVPGAGSVSFSISWPEGADVAAGSGTFDKGQASETALTLAKGSNAASASLPSVAAGEGHTFEIRLWNTAGASAYATNGTIHVTNGKNTPVAIDLSASSINNPPPAPQALTAQNGVFCVNLSWTESDGAEGYFIDRRLAGGSWSALTAAPIPAGTTTYRDTSPKPLTNYEYRVSAYNSLGESVSDPLSLSTARFSDAIVRSPVAFGEMNAFRILADGTVVGYGTGEDGQLGSSSKALSSTGVTINGLSRILSVKSKSNSDGGGAAVDQDGTVWWWGYNLNPTYIPQKLVGIDRPVIDISLNEDSYLALDADGRLWAWGSNSYGLFGNGGTTSSKTPTLVPGLPEIVSAVAASRHALAVAKNGQLYAWGDNMNGQLGLGDKTSRYSPVAVTGVANAKAVRACPDINSWNSFVILADGTVKAAGYMYGGGFGLPLDSYSTFTAIPGLSGIIDISPNRDSTIALSSNGSLYGSGMPGHNELLTPWPSMGVRSFTQIPEAPTGVTRLAGGEGTVYCETNDGNRYSWGWNNYGQCMTGSASVHPVPIQIATPSIFKKIVGGDNFFVALDANGDVWTWGGIETGQSGNGTIAASSIPIKFLDTSSPAIQIDASDSSAIALLQDGSIYTWGPWSTSPVLFSDANLGSNTDQVAIGAGFMLARRKTDGTVWAWGNNSYCQLGDGTKLSRTSAGQVKGVGGTGFLENISWIGAGRYWGIALTSDGSPICWGEGDNGVLGNGSENESNVPGYATGLSGVSSVFVGNKSVFAIKDSVTWMWGMIGSTSYLTPINYDTSVTPGISPVRSASFGYPLYPIALVARSDGVVRVYGENSKGQRGNGTVAYTSGWETVSGLADISMVAATDQASAALSSTGQLWTWGSNANGELGNGTIDPEGIDQPQLLPW
jgi:alpha-tubulin suppressor-like RCC1 family protein